MNQTTVDKCIRASCVDNWEGLTKEASQFLQMLCKIEIDKNFDRLNQSQFEELLTESTSRLFDRFQEIGFADCQSSDHRLARLKMFCRYSVKESVKQLCKPSSARHVSIDSEQFTEPFVEETQSRWAELVELRQQLMHCVKQLESPYKRIIELQIAGESLTEIAEKLGKTVSNVWNMRSRSFQALRKCLSGLGVEIDD